MSQIKDKYISIFEIENERDLNGNEVKVKRYMQIGRASCRERV